ncbi:MAG: hypothetical protein H6748_07500 [Spirochaetaceae bacterium]|nr:hypothetical protein [Myxococcales bacterium]MCB9723872.1 hypothetical protein [Spirochaetaceae bacterium]HPG24277.1 hypothetical protein [Myxococcota bacterium]
MGRLRLYRLLMGTLGVAFLLFGIAMVAAFFLYQRPHSTPGIPTGPVGHYFVAFTGCALIGWAGGLVGAARAPLASRTVGTTTAFVLVLMAFIRMVAWVIGDYWTWLGETPRYEAAGLLLAALALIWLRPTVAETMRAKAGAVVGGVAPAATEGGGGA